LNTLHLIECIHLDLIVEMTNITDNCLVFHFRHMFRGNDILIPNQVGSDLANEDEGVYFTFYDEDSMPLTRDWQWSSFFVESANEQGGMFILDEESTEKFTLVVSGTPEASGLYQVAMSAIKYYVGSTQSAIKTLGLGNTHITDPVFLEGSSN